MTPEIRPSSLPLVFPESDGKPMADNTVHYSWIVLIKENLETHFADNPNVFVAGDLFWYADPRDPSIVQVPDVMVVIGRPKHHRGSYQQWLEGGIAPQVVFEIRSPGNRLVEMRRKLQFYRDHGVEEYYLYDPETGLLEVYLRTGGNLRKRRPRRRIVSGRLGIRLESYRDGRPLQLFFPDGRPFRTMTEISQQLEAERERAEAERERAEAERERAEAERERAEAERERAEAQAVAAERLREQLRRLGIEPAA